MQLVNKKQILVLLKALTYFSFILQTQRNRENICLGVNKFVIRSIYLISLK